MASNLSALQQFLLPDISFGISSSCTHGRLKSYGRRRCPSFILSLPRSTEETPRRRIGCMQVRFTLLCPPPVNKISYEDHTDYSPHLSMEINKLTGPRSNLLSSASADYDRQQRFCLLFLNRHQMWNNSVKYSFSIVEGSSSCWKLLHELCNRKPRASAPCNIRNVRT